MNSPRRCTREIAIGTVSIGGENRMALQSMTATKTQNVAATVSQVNHLTEAGADVVRIAVDSRKDAEALIEIAGLPPDGVIKTRIAFEQLISRGIGDTIRVSLTVPNDRKGEEIAAGRQILADIAAGRVRSVVDYGLQTLNIISCPSCSRVENEAFVQLAQQVGKMTTYAKDHAITIAVMGCRVNGPGETDDADLGLWCGPNYVNLKRGPKPLGRYGYEDILPRLKQELDVLIAERMTVASIL